MHCAKNCHFNLYPDNKSKGNINAVGPRPMYILVEIKQLGNFVIRFFYHLNSAVLTLHQWEIIQEL